MNKYSGDKETKQQIVNSFPQGRTTICYVNPRSPENAVLYRSLSWDMVSGLMSIIFILVGAGGLMLVARPWIKSTRRRIKNMFDRKAETQQS